MTMYDRMTDADKSRLKSRIEQVLSDILSDKYECKATLHFEKRRGGECITDGEPSADCVPQPA